MSHSNYTNDMLLEMLDKQRGYTQDPNGYVKYFNACAVCQHYKEEGQTFFPPHEPSNNCESGQRTHCTCDRCF